MTSSGRLVRDKNGRVTGNIPDKAVSRGKGQTSTSTSKTSSGTVSKPLPESAKGRKGTISGPGGTNPRPLGGKRTVYRNAKEMANKNAADRMKKHKVD